MKTLILACFTLLVLSAPAQAQTGACTANAGNANTLAINPTNGCFTPSPDHAVNDPVTGVPEVTRYDILFILDGADVAIATPVQTQNLGKPTPNANNAIWYTLPSYPIGARYRNVVVAVGPDGTSPREVGALSNPFGRQTTAPPAAPGGHRVP